MTARTLTAEVACRRWDVAVIGAGPSGAFAAYHLARRGAAVLLIDRATFPRPKVCGCCLSPAAQTMLARAGLGNLPTDCGAVPLTTLRLAAGGRQARLPLLGWVALSRERFDAALVDAACRAGATFLPGTHARLGGVGDDARACVLRRGGEEAEVAAALVLAADGLGGQLLSRAALVPVCISPRSRVGAGVTMTDAASDYAPHSVFMACGTSGYVGLVRLEDRRLNVAAAFDSAFLRDCGCPGTAAARVLAEVGWPMPRGLTDAPWRGTPALTRSAEHPAAPRVLALGDAAGYVEPFTGEGIAWALGAAEAVVPLALQGWDAGSADAWTAWHRRGSRHQRLIRAVAWVVRRPQLVRAAVGLIARFPDLAGRIVARLFTPTPATLPPLPSPARTPAPRTAAGRRVAPAAPG
jgi:flavin-dependent dehydrogenase